MHAAGHGSFAGSTSPRSLTTSAAAARAGCERTTVWRAIQAGELPARRLGPHGHYRIRPEALDAWLRRTATEEDET